MHCIDDDDDTIMYGLHVSLLRYVLCHWSSLCHIHKDQPLLVSRTVGLVHNLDEASLLDELMDRWMNMLLDKPLSDG
jgi:hypothetical protein